MNHKIKTGCDRWGMEKQKLYSTCAFHITIFIHLFLCKKVFSWLLLSASIMHYKFQNLVEYKNKDPNHVEWSKALKELYLPGLRDYVKSFYPLGPVWNANGKTTISAPSKVSAPSGPAPPPPPASLFSTESSRTPLSSRPKQGMAAVFQEISSKPVTAGTFFSFIYLLLISRFEKCRR